MRPSHAALLAQTLLGIAAASNGAHAADYPSYPVEAARNVVALPPAAVGEYFAWASLYGGVHGGVGQAESDLYPLSQRARDLSKDAFRGTPVAKHGGQPVLGKDFAFRPGHHEAEVFGGFAGYNEQVEDVVYGLELDYSRSGFKPSNHQIFAPGDIQLHSGGVNYDVALHGRASVAVKDYGTLRARAGWAVGSFLPFATLGIAVGHATVTTAVTGVAEGGGKSFDSSVITRNNAYAPGLAAGVGVDILLYRSAFIRAEYQFVRFGNFKDTVSDALSARDGVVDIHVARAGVGAKF